MKINSVIVFILLTAGCLLTSCATQSRQTDTSTNPHMTANGDTRGFVMH